MAEKAVAITLKNIDALRARFEREDVTLPLAVGHFLVAPFDSRDEQYELLTKEVLLGNYTVVGKKLLNGFFEVRKR